MQLVEKQYQQKSEALYTFMPYKCYGYVLNVESNNLLFLKRKLITLSLMILS